jgi:1-deoxy-D-xylulose-5-phosphate synthase
MAVARDLKGDDFNVISIIGDGAMSAGMAYEAMNNAGVMKSKMVVILNDNDMSIGPAVGALSTYLSQLISSRPFHSIRELAKQVASRFPAEIERTAKRAEEMARGIVGGSTIFSQLGFFYIGPVDGHDLETLLPILKNLRDGRNRGPVLLHVVTEKGRGHPFGKESGEKYHAVPKFDVITGEQKKPVANAMSYTAAFTSQLINEAEKDSGIVAVTAAMPSGTGIDKFAERFPSRSFDVGIAEQHAVTFSAGLAAEGMKPFAAIYSTFLQRGYDQLVHDVVLQKLPVRFAIDRAGLVGADGATHAGAYDLAYLCCLPGMVVMAPSDEAELMSAVATAAAYDDGPVAFRYPRGEGMGCTIPDTASLFTIGKGRIVREGERLAVIALGTRLYAALTAADMLAQTGASITVADARFAKPIDTELVDRLIAGHDNVIVIEEGSGGGFAAHVMQYLANSNQINKVDNVRIMTLPDRLIGHNSQEQQLAEAALDAGAIIATAAPLIDIDPGVLLKTGES